MFDVIFIFSIAYLVFLLLFLITYRKRMLVAFAEKKFFRGVASILDSVKDNVGCIPQINMIFKKLTEHYTPMTERYNSSLDILEELILIYKTSTPKQFKRRYGLELSPAVTDRLLDIRDNMKKQQPFSSISAKRANLLNMLNEAITANNPKLGSNTLDQLADEIEIMEGNVQSLDKKVIRSSIISVLGVILTLFFGSVAFIQLLGQSI